MNVKKEHRVGEIGYNNKGTKMKIIVYRNWDDMIIEFQDDHKYKTKTTYNSFKKGTVKNPFDRTVYNVGYKGVGKYNILRHGRIYDTWTGLLRRCYDPYTLNKEPTYINCTVEDELLNFQNFAKWYEENYYEVDNEQMELDKDILLKNNKVYCKEYMIFVPKRINLLIVNSKNRRGELPIGVYYYNKQHDKFYAHCSIVDEHGKAKRQQIGVYNTVDEAFLNYKEYKERYIKKIADEYKSVIPEKLYVALYNYKIEITD